MTLVQPTVEMQQHIRSELNEDVSTRENDLQHIKEWLRLQPHLPQFQGEISVIVVSLVVFCIGIIIVVFTEIFYITLRIAQKYTAIIGIFYTNVFGKHFNIFK